MTALIAFHNDLSIKTKLLADLAEHEKMDRIQHGQYWRSGKGCAIACTLVSFDKEAAIAGRHAAYEPIFGIPQGIARLEDRIFEGLSNGKAKEWPARFANAIEPGADLTMVWPKFVYWMLSEELPKYVQQEKHAKQKAAISDIAEMYRKWCETGVLPERGVASDLRSKARASYYAADADAAAYAAYAADAAAADAAAYAAYATAAYAAAAAAYADADDADARSLTYERMADKLVELLKAAPLAK